MHIKHANERLFIPTTLLFVKWDNLFCVHIKYNKSTV